MVVNVLLVNLGLVLVGALVVTLPLSGAATFAALDRWKTAGEERLLGSFLAALRRARAWRVTVVGGAPMLAWAIGLEEVHYFAHSSLPAAHACFGLGVCTLFLATAATGYVLLIMVREPELQPAAVWSKALRLAVGNLIVSGIPTALATASVVVLLLTDPALCLLGLPLAAAYVSYRTADYGVRRAGLRGR